MSGPFPEAIWVASVSRAASYVTTSKVSLMLGCEALKSSTTFSSVGSMAGSSPVPRQQYHRISTARRPPLERLWPLGFQFPRFRSPAPWWLPRRPNPMLQVAAPGSNETGELSPPRSYPFLVVRWSILLRFGFPRNQSNVLERGLLLHLHRTTTRST